MKKIVLFLPAFLIFIFFLQRSSRHLFVNNKPPAQPTPTPTSTPAIITLMAVGDLGLGREINWQIQQRNDPTFPFQKITSVIQSADIATANLEGPVIENCPFIRTGFKFCGDIQNTQGLKFAGFDLINLANNHIANYGPDGIRQTIQSLTKNNLDYFNSEKIVYLEIQNLRLAFLGFDDIVRRVDLDNLKNAIKASRENSDLVVVNFHWGEEYQKQPNERQCSLAALAVDAGADIIIGHHPHVVQPLEYYKDKPIFYSLGNFLFDQLWSQETRKGGIAKIEIEKKQIKSAEIIPIYINDQYQVEIQL